MSNISSLVDEEPDLFSARAEWADVIPIQQYESPNPLAPIFYTVEYTDATDYFRGIVKKGEKSPRVLELTEAIIRINPAHYSAWQYRYETLLELSADLTTELKLMDELGVKFLKNYQVWHHRRLLVTLTKTPRAELAFIQKGLEVDEKNYHTWSYRQWLLAHFDGITSDQGNIWDGELDFVDAMLTKDVRNNSAWHHRFFVVWGCGVREGEEDRLEVFRRELTYVKQFISVAPNNPSAWNYLRGILEHNTLPFTSVRGFVLPYTAVPLSTNSDTMSDPPQPVPPSVTHTGGVVDLENPVPSKDADLPVPAAIEFMADIWEKEGTVEAMGKAIELWKSLATQHDMVRKKYWELRIRNAHALTSRS